MMATGGTICNTVMEKNHVPMEAYTKANTNTARKMATVSRSSPTNHLTLVIMFGTKCMAKEDTCGPIGPQSEWPSLISTAIASE